MVTRLFVEKKEGFDVAAHLMLEDLRDYLKITSLESVRILVRYDVEGLSETDLEMTKPVIFSEPPVDTLYSEEYPLADSETAFAIEYLPGQYDQRADSAAQSAQIMTHGEIPTVRCAQIIVLKGSLTEDEVTKIKQYLINPVDSHEASLEKPESLKMVFETPADVEIMEGFIEGDDSVAEALRTNLGLAMNSEDIIHCRDYFRNDEKRNPTITEIKLLDTYWSDHCRHTTFMTNLGDVTIEEGTIVGAGSVVTRNIPAREIWAGNPAKFIRKLDD